MRVLVLHGSRQTGEMFRCDRLGVEFEARLQKLLDRHDLEFEYPDAPHSVEGGFSWTSGGELSVSLASLQKETDIVIGFSSGASMALALASSGFVKRAAILASPPLRPSLEDWGIMKKIKVPPMLVVCGVKDELVPLGESVAVVHAVSSEAQVYQHAKGHCLPIRASDMREYARFLKKALLVAEEDHVSESGAAETRQEIEDEAEALEAIFADDFQRREATLFAITLDREGLAKSLSEPLALIARLPLTYPQTHGPRYTIETRMNGLEFPHAASNALRDAADQAFVPNEPSIYSAVIACNDLLRDHAITARPPIQQEAAHDPAEENDDVGEDDDDDMSQVQAAATRTELEALWRNARHQLDEEYSMTHEVLSANAKQEKKRRGVWELSVGIVGKPSVGKSTFFNAVTRSTGALAAKTAAYPFTTIDPNVREAIYAIPIECEPDQNDEHIAKQDLAFGRDAQGRRLMPILLKDVAGLVPGAYKGLGKGNRFLNDLCDTDALLHVVDASGQTDTHGEQITEDSTDHKLRDEVIWVREELHRWIVGNVAAKFSSVTRLAKYSIELARDRLRNLFGGYHCSPGLADRALTLASLDTTSIEHWTPMHLHRLVAAFLELRFPTVIALNKCDRPGAKDKVAEFLLDTSRFCPALPCSASIDAMLVRDRTESKIKYLDGATDFTELVSHAPSAAPARHYFSLWGHSTGTLDVLSLAVSRARPTYAFVVSDLDTLEGALARRQQHESARKNTGPLSDCLPLRPNATVNDVYHALKSLGLAGDFVRADALDRALTTRRVVKRHEPIDNNTCVIRIATNKKSQWQSSYHASTSSANRKSNGNSTSKF